MPKVCILANCLIKGQQAFNNKTHGGCSLAVLRAATAYTSSPWPGQCPPPPGIVYEVHLWHVVKEQNNAVRAVIFSAMTLKTSQGIQ